MNRRIVSLSVFVLLVSTGSSWAHHGYQVEFDGSKKYTLTGTLTKVDWRNPHIELSIDAKRDRDHVEAWVIEAAPPLFFARRSISKTAFQKAIGQTVTVEAYRAKDGRPKGSLLKITFPDGTSVSNDPSV